MTTSIIRFPSIVLAALFAGTASGAAPAVNMKMTMSGPHANEAFCKTIAGQIEHFAEDMKLGMSADKTERAKFYAGLKVWNAKLVKTAPASLASDVALTTKAANAWADAELAGDRGNKAAVAGLTSPERMAADKRMGDYCGVKF